MTKAMDELRARIGSKKVDKIKAFADKAKAEGKSPEQVKAAIQAKFKKDLKAEDASPVIFTIISGGGR